MFNQSAIINYNAFKNTDGLNSVYHSINMLCARRIHMGMDYRINLELSKQAGCMCHSDEWFGHMIDLRNRMMLETDYKAYKASLGL